MRQTFWVVRLSENFHTSTTRFSAKIVIKIIRKDSANKEVTTSNKPGHLRTTPTGLNWKWLNQADPYTLVFTFKALERLQSVLPEYWRSSQRRKKLRAVSSEELPWRAQVLLFYEVKPITISQIAVCLIHVSSCFLDGNSFSWCKLWLVSRQNWKYTMPSGLWRHRKPVIQVCVI